MVGSTAGYMVVVVVCLIIVSTPGTDFAKVKVRFSRLVTRLARARFGQVGDQVDQVKDHWSRPGPGA